MEKYVPRENLYRPKQGFNVPLKPWLRGELKEDLKSEIKAELGRTMDKHVAVFRDEDGAYYLIYGGWRHCNIARLNDTFTGFIPFADGSTFKEITPTGYVEGAYMFMKDGRYYFMWSEGGWTGPNYAVAYAIGSLLNNLFGTKLKVVTGYKGSKDIYHAVEQRELDAIGGLAWLSIRNGLKISPKWNGVVLNLQNLQ